MFRVAEEFFTSLGLLPMPPEFWAESMHTCKGPLDNHAEAGRGSDLPATGLHFVSQGGQH